MRRWIALSCALCAVALTPPPAAAQNWELDGAAVKLSFEADTAAGVVLRSIRNPASRAVALNDTTLAPSLWEVVLYDTMAPTVPKVVTALSPRSSFCAQECRGALHLTWNGVSVPGTSDRINVFLEVAAPDAGAPLDFASRWDVSVHHANPRRARTRTFRVNYPVIAIDPLDNGFLTADLLQGSATPQAIFPGTFLDTAGPLRIESVHPGKGTPVSPLSSLPPGVGFTDLHMPGISVRQTFQFSCLRFHEIPGVPVSTPLENEFLWIGSDDSRGYFKTYNMETVPEPIGEFGVHAAYRWSVGHFPAMDPDPRERRAWSYRSPYSSLVGLKPYRGTEWWFDAIEPYRDWVRRDRVVPLGPIEHNPIFRQSAWDENSIYQGTVSYAMLGPVSGWPAGLADDHLTASVKLAEDYRAAFPDAAMNLQWQFTSEQPIEPTTPVTPPMFAGLRSAIAALHQRVPDSAVAYYHRFDVPVNEPPPAIDPARRFDYGVYNLDGSLRVRTDNAAPGYPLMNFGARAARGYLFNKILWPYATRVGASAVYMDILGGSGPEMSYGNWTAPIKYNAHPPGGGAYWERGKRFYVAAAQILYKLFNRSRPSFVLTEHTEETLAGWLDGCGQQAGRTPFVDYRLFLPFLPGPGVIEQELDVPFLPPMWNAIYHEYQPTAALNILHTVSWLQSMGGPLTDAQFLELALYAHMVEYVTGNNPFNFLVATESETEAVPFPPLPAFGEGLFEVDSSGELQPTDPSGTGLALVRRLQDLHKARQENVGGPWLLRGRMERPMSVIRFRSQFHPLSYLAIRDLNLVPWWPLLSYARNILQPPALYSFFPALTTYHSVWSAPDAPGIQDSRLLTVVNWSAQPSDLALRFDPAAQFGESTTPRQVYAIDLDTGARTALATDVVGSVVLDFGGNYGGPEDSVGLPQVPAQGVVLYEIR